MSKTPSISIIVPVYNAEAYLRRCVDSILRQTFTDWELVLVDDGSQDRSGEICEVLVAENPGRAIRVIHQVNGGVSSARETGMKNASGKYSIHIDPDDWIEDETLNTIYLKARETDADIVIFDFLLDYGARHKEVSCQKVSSSEELLKGLLSQQRHGSVCNKLILTSLYRKYDIHFPPQMICWEDLYVCCNLLIHPCKVAYVPQAFYHYDLHSNKNSMTRQATLTTIESMKFFCDFISKQIDQNCMSWLNEIKGLVKITAYRCNLMSAEQLRNLYPEINQWFTEKYSVCYTKVFYHGLALVLSGHTLKYAHRVQAINSLIQRIKTKVKKFFR